MIDIRRPNEILRPWIECYWNVEQNIGANEKTETILPNGKIEMIFAIEGNYQVINRQTNKMNHAWLSGIHHQPLQIKYSGKSNLIGVRFYPHGIFPFLNIPIKETINQVENLNSFWGVFQEEIFEGLCKVKDKEQVFSLMDHFLIRKISENKIKHHQVIANVIGQIQKDPSIPFPTLVSSLGFTQRHFNRLFKDQTGITPKLLAQIFRFEKSFSYIFNHSDDGFSNLISSMGYYDQSHFNKEFKHFSGMTPGDYKKRAINNNNFL